MITFGNEGLQSSVNNSNNLQAAKKSDEFELLKRKYKKLEKENKMLKATLDELINLTETLKSSFKNTESMYITISDSFKNVLGEKFYNTGLANSSDNLIRSQILNSHDNILNLNQGKSLNCLATGQLAELNKDRNNNSSLNLNGSSNLPININLNSNTNITNIYNNNGNESRVTTSFNNKILNWNDNTQCKISNLDEEETKRKSSLDDSKHNSRKNSLKRNSNDKNVVLTLGEENTYCKFNLENNNKEKENINAIKLGDHNIDNDLDVKSGFEIESKSNDNMDAVRDPNDSSKGKDFENNLEREFSEKSNNSSINNKFNEDKKEFLNSPNEDLSDKNILNNTNTNDNSTYKDSNKNSNASHSNKLENKDNRNFSSEINLELEFENITKLILDNHSKKDENNEDFLNKLADNLSELQKKFFQIKFEKEEYEKINIEILKTLKQTEENYNIISVKYDELNKYIDILYKSIHSILVLSDNTNDKAQTVKCEPVPSYLRFINNVIN